ncbi:MAG: ABC transporter ATP-binding protein [Candidatus Marinimicrobia bacterium]|nr:ABC transporter ATP-binding protein [Candidatus Neomarinimicrobiota bacterium]
MIAIKTIDLTKNYKDICAVDSLNLEIKEGELFSLLGVNGAGKTTTIKCLSCLSKPSTGDALILGNSILKNEIEVKKLISVSPQETAVAPNLSVKENLGFICGVNGFNKSKSQDYTLKTIKNFDMEEIKNKQAGKLSGGWQRRLSIAMAIISEPKILFLDEPTLGLDVLARRELWALIKDLKKHMTIILTTHYMEEAEALSDRIGIMSKGKLIAKGSAIELISQTRAKNFEEAFIEIAGKRGEIK